MTKNKKTYFIHHICECGSKVSIELSPLLDDMKGITEDITVHYIECSQCME